MLCTCIVKATGNPTRKTAAAFENVDILLNGQYLSNARDFCSKMYMAAEVVAIARWPEPVHPL